MRRLLIFLAVALLLALPTLAFAQAPTPAPTGDTSLTDGLAVVNGLFGDTPLPWLPTAKVLAVIVAATQAIKKLMRFAPILDRYTHDWASVILNALVSTMAIVVPALGAGHVTVDTIVQLVLAIGASGGLYELAWRLFHKQPPPPGPPAAEVPVGAAS